MIKYSEALKSFFGFYLVSDLCDKQLNKMSEFQDSDTHRIVSTSDQKLTFPSDSNWIVGTAFRNARIVCDVEDKNGTQTIEIPMTMKRLFEIDLGETIGQAIKRARDERLKYDTAKNQT